MSTHFGHGNMPPAGPPVCRHGWGARRNSASTAHAVLYSLTAFERAQKRGWCLAGALCSNLSLSPHSTVTGNGGRWLGHCVINHCCLGQAGLKKPELPCEPGQPVRGRSRCCPHRSGTSDDGFSPAQAEARAERRSSGGKACAVGSTSLMADSAVRDGHLVR
jgi:hypothetical protein